jgi:hypothetical protein
MGAVLAMRPIFTLLPVLLIGLLAACGTSSNQQSVQIARGLLAGALGGGAPPQDPRVVLSREVIDRAQTPLILVDTLQLSGSGTMLSTGRAGRYSSWAGRDQAGIVLLDDGLLTATRGYGGDLISADVDAVVEALQTGDGAIAVRVMRYIDGEDDDYTRSMVCSFSDAGREVITIFDRDISTRALVEDCQSSHEDIRNRYWIGSDGFIWRSIQYAGPELGYFQIERLFR